MAAKRKTMLQIRLLLKKFISNQSIREISRSISMSRNTVKKYKAKFTQSGLTLEEIQLLEDEKLYEIVNEGEKNKNPVKNARLQDLRERLPDYIKDLKRVGVTRRLLWEEYRQEVPEGLGYTQFCEHISKYIERNDLSAMFDHRPGEVLQIDFAGKPFHYVDLESGELIACPVFVCILPFSNTTFVKALPSQKQEYFINGIRNAFEYIGGVPKSVLIDNLKSGVKKANRYEPQFTELIEQLSAHYSTTFMATRVRKPKDKSHVEGGVRLSYQRLYAPLRNQVFHSIEQINEAFRKQLDIHHNKLFSGKDYNRYDLLEEEKEYLQPLPTEPFIVKHSTISKVQKNYHVLLGEDKHMYSVPYQLVGKRLKLIYDINTVEIYDELKRITVHKRDFRKNKYTTKEQHMPPNHLKYYEQGGWDASYFRNWAKKIGTQTLKAIESILESKKYVQQTYRSCIGIISLGKKYGNQRLESACARANTFNSVSYMTIKNILENNLDKARAQEKLFNHKTPAHENIRGKSNYK